MPIAAQRGNGSSAKTSAISTCVTSDGRSAVEQRRFVHVEVDPPTGNAARFDFDSRMPALCGRLSGCLRVIGAGRVQIDVAARRPVRAGRPRPAQVHRHTSRLRRSSHFDCQVAIALKLDAEIRCIDRLPARGRRRRRARISSTNLREQLVAKGVQPIGAGVKHVVHFAAELRQFSGTVSPAVQPVRHNIKPAIGPLIALVRRQLFLVLVSRGEQGRGVGVALFANASDAHFASPALVIRSGGTRCNESSLAAGMLGGLTSSGAGPVAGSGAAGSSVSAGGAGIGGGVGAGPSED